MFQGYLAKYKSFGQFSFKSTELLEKKCNAPTDKSGIYLIYKIVAQEEILIYIGSSGQKKKDGTLKTRQSGLGGMKDRLVNGYHPKFGKIKRKISFPKQMLQENISELRFYWYVTFGDNTSDFPSEVEMYLRNQYVSTYNRMPDWHK